MAETSEIEVSKKITIEDRLIPVTPGWEPEPLLFGRELNEEECEFLMFELIKYPYILNLYNDDMLVVFGEVIDGKIKKPTHILPYLTLVAEMREAGKR